MGFRTCPCGLLVAVVSLIAWSGCAKPQPDIAPVEGTVMLDSSPLIGGQITFISLDGVYRADGRVDSKGSYRLSTLQPDDGAVVGMHRVVIKPPYGLGGGALLTVPDHYGNEKTTNLEREVVPGVNVLDFNLVLEPIDFDDSLGLEDSNSTDREEVDLLGSDAEDRFAMPPAG